MNCKIIHGKIFERETKRLSKKQSKNEQHLLLIYDKNEFDSIDSKIIKKLIEEINKGF